MKSQEQRVRDAAQEANRLIVGSTFAATKDGNPLGIVSFVERILEAADREPPAWPTDDSVDLFYGAIDDTVRAHIPRETARGALMRAFQADPILAAALNWRQADDGRAAIEQLRLAIDNAGLL